MESLYGSRLRAFGPTGRYNPIAESQRVTSRADYRESIERSRRDGAIARAVSRAELAYLRSITPGEYRWTYRYGWVLVKAAYRPITKYEYDEPYMGSPLKRLHFKY